MLRRFNNSNKKVFILILIIILAFFVRVFKNTTYPNGFFGDEAAIGYNAYKLLSKGQDEHAKKTPLFFQSFGEYRLPVAVYSNIPVIAVFGLNEFSVRLTTALYGAGTVLLVFLIGTRLHRSKTGLLSAFLLATSAWHIHISRWGAEYAYFPFYFALGFYFFLLALKKKFWLVFSFICFAICFYAYYTAWVVVPVFITTVSVYFLIKKGRKGVLILLLSLVVFSFMSYPLIKGFKDGSLLTRWNHITDQKIIFWEKIKKYPKYYLDHFNTKYLFFTGDYGYPGRFITRQFPKNMGFLEKYYFILLITGLSFSLIKIRKAWILVIIIMLLYPIGSALTSDGPMTTRSVIGVLPFSLLVGLGLGIIYSSARKNLIPAIYSLVITLLILINFQDYLYHYYLIYPSYSSDFWGWQYGPKDIFNYFMSVEKDYDELIYAGEFNGGDIFLPFYTVDKTLGCVKCFGGDIKRLDLNKKQLFVASPGLLKDSWKNPNFNIIKKFYYQNGAVAFQAVVYTKKL